MYNVSLYSNQMNQNTNILKLYQLAIDNNLINNPLIFCDSSELISKTPSLHTFNLLSKNLLVLTDNTVFDIVDTYRSNRFICIDIKGRHDYSKVDFYDIQQFNDPSTYVETLKNILSHQDYKQYAI